MLSALPARRAQQEVETGCAEPEAAVDGGCLGADGTTPVHRHLRKKTLQHWRLPRGAHPDEAFQQGVSARGETHGAGLQPVHDLFRLSPLLIAVIPGEEIQLVKGPSALDSAMQAASCVTWRMT